MAAICWWDSKPVHFLSVGGNLTLDRVARREKTGEQNEVTCPKVIKDYHRFMGGVDVHNHLRLQRYSVQCSITFRKYYKSLFLGLVDLAITNGYIVHRIYCNKRNMKAMTHVQYMCKLYMQLIELKAEDMYEGNTFQAGAEWHVPKQGDDWREHSRQRKRVQKNCKVCTILNSDGKRGATTTYFCDGCNFPGPIYLCMKPKWPVKTAIMSCWENWHSEYKNGKEIPANKMGKIRVRATKAAASPGTSPAKRHRKDIE
uniref:PiggyBac transposable element-derived protein domain-containing protein n=1 Tax=Phytophthora ramorum TaxID=164328 RepID=H3H0C5_PHYRM